MKKLSGSKTTPIQISSNSSRLNESEISAFIVLEWLEGFPLVDLLRARRALTLREMLMLLQQIAPAVDAARMAKLSLEMKLRDIFLHFPESFAEPVATIVLRCPLDEWPAFVVKMSPLEKVKILEASAGSSAEQTIISDLKPQRDVVQLGILSYELLGGKLGGFAPLAHVSEKGNEILKQCLTPDRSFSTAVEFYDCAARNRQWETGASGKRHQAAATRAANGSTPTDARRFERRRCSDPERTADQPRSCFDEPFLADHRSPDASCCWPSEPFGFFFRSILTQTSNQQPPVVTETHPQKANAPLGSHPPPQPGKPWTNSLEMSFVPIGDLYISEWQTRKRDFEAFVQATGYDAVGGMSSAVTQNGFKLNEMSWKAPGFKQAPDHPVVGVSWEDANQFCAWLTKKERSEGTLGMFQSYRLPTDREWSRAAGLEHEPGNTPKDRSGRKQNPLSLG